MLEIKALTKYYRNVPVVNNVNFTVYPAQRDRLPRSQRIR